MYRWLFRLFALLAVGCLAGAAYLYEPTQYPTLEVVNLTQDVGELPLNVETPATVVFRNTGSRPRRILNINSMCVPSCCWRQEATDAVVVPPYGEASFVVLLKPTRPGPFTCEPTIYLDDAFLREVSPTFNGIGK